MGWKDDCWIFSVDHDTDAVSWLYGEERNASGHLVVTADPDLKQAGLLRILEDYSKNPSTEIVHELDNNVIIYNNDESQEAAITENLRKIVDKLRKDA